ncbi:MAG: hypothetical protein CMJ46_10180 [Planctomyces sp.]|nr:hypothetical protein [Planctomyces sp.]
MELPSTSTPPQLAKRWRVKVEQVYAWIKSGELEAYDLSFRTGSRRPRYKIYRSAVEAFEKQRKVKPVVKQIEPAKAPSCDFDDDPQKMTEANVIELLKRSDFPFETGGKINDDS